MTLMRCPDCGRNVSDAALTCPTCGRPMRRAGARPGVAAASPGYSFEYVSKRKIFGVPLVHVVYGPVWLVGFRPARGIVAVGNIAIGAVALGGVAVGGIALAGISLGLVSLAGIAIGLGFGLGGIATGYVAVGGVAVGVYAFGGAALGTHTLQNDPELVRALRSLVSR